LTTLLTESPRFDKIALDIDQSFPFLHPGPPRLGLFLFMLSVLATQENCLLVSSMSSQLCGQGTTGDDSHDK
jgi:hypothetical protein